MPVEVLARSVIAHGGSRVGMACGDLDVAEADPGVEAQLLSLPARQGSFSHGQQRGTRARRARSSARPRRSRQMRALIADGGVHYLCGGRQVSSHR